MALKLSNGYASQLNKEGILQELKRFSTCRLICPCHSQLTHRVLLSDYPPIYMHHGIEADGERLYLVTYGTARNRHPIHTS